MSLALRRMTSADLAFGETLRALAGWNQTVADWKRILSLEPDGCFVAQWDGLPVGTATTTCYGTALAWIGMVLVHPDFRGRGVGRALMDHCLEYLNGRGVRSIMLDATPLGERLYTKLGFSVASQLARWERPAASDKVLSDDARRVSPSVEMSLPNDWEAVVRFDTRVFGVPRQRLLEGLMRDSLATLVTRSASELTGFGMIRRGMAADYLGPIEADDPICGERLIRSLLERSGKLVYWDIPEENHPAVELAEQIGFRRQRPLARMRYGAVPPAGNPSSQFAIADPACG